MPLNQQVKGRHGERQPCVEIRPAPVHNLFEVHDERQHRQHRLYEQAILPFPARTHFQVARISLGGMDANITQDNHAPFQLSNQKASRVCGPSGPSMALH